MRVQRRGVTERGESRTHGFAVASSSDGETWLPAPWKVPTLSRSSVPASCEEHVLRASPCRTAHATSAVSRRPRRARRRRTRPARTGARPRPCCGWSRAGRCPRRRDVEQARSRTRSATSGSSDAVGSSSTSRRGWCRIAFTMPTSVRWPDDSSMHMRSAQVGDAGSARGRVLDAASRAVGDAVEAGEDAERLAHPEPVGQGQVAGGEPDPLAWPRLRCAREPVTARSRSCPRRA